MSRPLEELRADAARNVQRIVEAAARRLAADPRAGMADVAAAAGVGRATVYRHFPTRAALIHAIQAQAIEDSEAALAAARLDEGSATDALRRLVAAWLDVAERYALPQLARQPELNTSEAAQAHKRHVLGEPLVALIIRGQAGGEFSSARSPAWLARVFGALLIAGARAVGDGTLTAAEAPDAVFDQLLEGLRG